MKSTLFSNFDHAQSQLVNAQAAVNWIHASRVNYNYVVSIPYEHKYKVSWGWFKTSWVWDTETRYRKEIRFNQGRFDNDLAQANQNLSQAQALFNAAEGAIDRETIAAQNQINYIDNLESQVNNLSTNNNSLQNSLSKIHVSSYNLQEQVNNFNARKNDLTAQKNNLAGEVRNLPDKINELNNDNIYKKSQVENLTEQQKQVNAAEYESYKKLQEKFSSLSEIERSILAYEMIVTNNQSILAMLEQCGLFVEKIAQIAVAKNVEQAFDYCIFKGIKFDALISKQETLALNIIHSGNEFFINKLFAATQNIKMTIFMACVNDDFKALDVILQRDAQALQKFKEVEGCGFGVLQYAVACNNAALIDYAIKHDPLCLREALVGHESYLQMALTYNDQNVIKLIADNSDIDQEINNLINSNQVDLFERLVTNIELSQEQVLSILKSCINNNCFSMSEMIIEKVKDIQSTFLKAVQVNDQDLASTLILLKPDQLSYEYVSSLMDSIHDEQTTMLLNQILFSKRDESEQIESELLAQDSHQQNYELQADHQH